MHKLLFLISKNEQSGVIPEQMCVCNVFLDLHADLSRSCCAPERPDTCQMSRLTCQRCASSPVMFLRFNNSRGSFCHTGQTAGYN